MSSTRESGSNPAAFSTLKSAKVKLSFHVNTQINVTALATYKNDGAVLQAGHLVSLWSATGDNTPLATATVTPADPAVTVPYSPHPHFYYHRNITPLLLTPGDYVVGGTPASEDFFFQSNGVLSAPAITFLEGRYGYVVDGRPEGNFTLPAFGGNFLFTAADEDNGPNGVPAPSSVVLLVIGAGLAATAAIRNRIKRDW